MTFPQVSVVLPVYNGAADVAKAVDSILSQTYKNFELIIIDDGSKDDSYSLLKSFTDSRITLIRQDNMGLAATLNRGISLARGRYIARQDQDDISLTDRLAKQVAYMESHPECALLGTAADIWVGDYPTSRGHDHPTEHGILCFELLFNNPFVHSSVMLNRHSILHIGGYSTDPLRQPPEDFELWSRIARHFHVANLAERLVVYREVPNSMSRAGPNPFLDRVVTICAENLAYTNNLELSNQTCINVAALTHSASHRFSTSLNIRDMSNLVIHAGELIANTYNCPEVINRAQHRVKILRYQHFLQRSNTNWARPLLSVIRTINSKLHRPNLK
ncbi:family 2 glycosyl transferase [Novimethylophilus kurashikiensis]|uniref:Family 2 glycosyl transferase n=1 Tax=Novimethylophilus kurashikiensis TaxID=1825523 RepID=A0A2R5F6W9_9PROT|nr:glycosyltransferase family A protein [Novimethylophilus kurashikiensis]GBG13298.1 family 2 glycosyl transferase [Novimethylophilus kurashikiensis]